MRKFDLRRVLIVSGVSALLIIYAMLCMRMISSPAERTGSDFIAFYTGGRVADLWGPPNVYNLAYQQAVQEQVVGFELAPGQVLMFNHVPFLVPFLSLLAGENYTISLAGYMLVMAALYAAALVVVWRLFRMNGWRRRDTLVAVLGMATFYPLFVSLLNTQDTSLMVLGSFLWLLGLLTGRNWLAGIGLALTTVRPQITLVLAVPFLFRRQKVFGWFCLGALVLGLISFLSVGLDGIRSFIQLLLTTAGGDWYGVKEPAMVNLIGLLWRLTPGLGTTVIHWIGWGVYGVVLAGLCLLWRRSREIGPRQVGVAIPLALFAAPHLHYHDLTMLLVPLAAGMLALAGGDTLRQKDASLAPLAVSLVLLFGSLAPLLKYNLPCLVMALLLLVSVLWSPGTCLASKSVF